MSSPKRYNTILFLLACLSPSSSTLYANALSNNPASSVAADVQYLERKVEELFRDAKKMPVVLRKQLSGRHKNNNSNKTKNKIEVRTTFDGDSMVSVAEATKVDHHPDDFKDFLVNFRQAFPQVNPMARNVVHLEGDKDANSRGGGSGREAVKSVLNFPFPLANRIMVHWKYLRLNRSDQQNEHMLIISERNNQDLLRKHLTTEERNKYVLARTFLCVYWIRPIHDPSGNVCGSNIRYAFSGDTGGTIPAFVQNQVGPKTALDSIQGLLEYVKKYNKK